eukprot:gb/GECH01012391.1/.p1 GENE.gb/GECH01012391.1/~~gb/GECH01012391.1/.p1  ORF type:complete len:684 (+),score=165.09 gb/GECH01012391.1/:1-2052(+)
MESIPTKEGRPSKFHLACFMARLAEYKPDSVWIRNNSFLRQTLSEKNKGHRLISKEITGAVVLSKTLKIMAVEGSGLVHASISLCNSFGKALEGTTICLSKRPCVTCLKLLIQCGVYKIVYDGEAEKESEAEKERHFGDASSVVNSHASSSFNENGDKTLQLLFRTAPVQVQKISLDRFAWKKKALDTFIQLVLQHDHIPPRERKRLFPITMKMWCSALTVVAAWRSQDPTLKVGAAIIRESKEERCIGDTRTKGIEVLAIGYNGASANNVDVHFDVDRPSSEYDALKGYWSVHAEQNAMIYRMKNKESLDGTQMFCTDEPCRHCYLMMEDQGIRSKFYICKYKNIFRDETEFHAQQLVDNDQLRAKLAEEWKSAFKEYWSKEICHLECIRESMNSSVRSLSLRSMDTQPMLSLLIENKEYDGICDQALDSIADQCYRMDKKEYRTFDVLKHVKQKIIKEVEKLFSNKRNWNQSIYNNNNNDNTQQKKDPMKFPKISEAETRKVEYRRVKVPQHMYKQLKTHWMEIYTPIVDHMKLQIRMNTKNRCVEIRSSKHTEDVGALQKAVDFLEAFMLGFKVQDAVALLRMEDLYVESFEIKDVKTLKGSHLSRAIARIAGSGGKTKFTIENTTRTRIVINNTKIHILGTFQNIRVARDAIVTLILGSPAGKVYGKLRTVMNRINDTL